MQIVSKKVKTERGKCIYNKKERKMEKKERKTKRKKIELKIIGAVVV